MPEHAVITTDQLRELIRKIMRPAVERAVYFINRAFFRRPPISKASSARGRKRALSRRAPSAMQTCSRKKAHA